VDDLEIASSLRKTRSKRTFGSIDASDQKSAACIDIENNEKTHLIGFKETVLRKLAASLSV
jgi:hypothetical protein